MIRIEKLVKKFGDHEVLKQVSTQFEAGHTNLIIGRSGSGKTVLLKTIVGLHEVTSGHVYYGDRDFTQMRQKERKLLRQEIGMVFQGGALFDSLSVAENVRFPMDMFTRASEAEKRARVEFCLDRVNIRRDAFHLSPSEISGGMQKRVAIARAIVLNPKYLFCDEPNSGLDPSTSIVIDKLIHEITQEYNITTVINTHDMNSVMEIGDHILFISEGNNTWEGNRHEILLAENAKLQEFVFANPLYKEVRDVRLKSNS
ncbi:MAG: ABC transporter ATP-binding protein [Mangrovibacterium sp.]